MNHQDHANSDDSSRNHEYRSIEINEDERAHVPTANATVMLMEQQDHPEEEQDDEEGVHPVVAPVVVDWNARGTAVTATATATATTVTVTGVRRKRILDMEDWTSRLTWLLVMIILVGMSPNEAMCISYHQALV